MAWTGILSLSQEYLQEIRKRYGASFSAGDQLQIFSADSLYNLRESRTFRIGQAKMRRQMRAERGWSARGGDGQGLSQPYEW